MHRSERKRNKAGFPGAASGVLNAAGIVYMAAACVWVGVLPLSVQAAPAALTSPDAAVYEQTDEGSRQVGNLVEGSTFEYIGDVTAEDGSVWHQITTSGGVNGYIRGDREIEIESETEASAGEEQGGQEATAEEQGGQETSAEENENTAAENGQPGNGEGAGADTGEALDGNPGEEEALAEENEGLEENNAAESAGSMQNNQAKKYVLDQSGKIKERENLTDSNAEINKGKSTGAGIDKALAAGTAVIVFCAAAIHFCLAGMRRIKWETQGRGMPDAGRGRPRKKAEKKKHSHKRKEYRPEPERRHESARRKKQQAAGKAR